MSAKNLNALYESYQQAPPETKEAARTKLIKAMYQNGYAIASAKMRSIQPYIVSDAVAQAVFYLDKFRGEAAFSTWFFKIVVNFCNKNIKKNLRRREISLDQLVEESGEEIAGISQGAETSDLREILERLDAEERRLVELKLDGMSDREIGKVLGLTRSGVSSRWLRLKQRLSARAKRARVKR